MKTQHSCLFVDKYESLNELVITQISFFINIFLVNLHRRLGIQYKSQNIFLLIILKLCHQKFLVESF